VPANPKWQKAALFLNLVGTVILLMIIGLIVAIYTTSLSHPWDYFVPPLSLARIPHGRRIVSSSIPSKSPKATRGAFKALASSEVRWG
jgi:hypothetical protein